MYETPTTDHGRCFAFLKYRTSFPIQTTPSPTHKPTPQAQFLF